MTQTTNYDLNLVEGTDKVNPLTQMNPNFEKIDEEMKKNADSGITVATELLTGSIHGLLRANADCSMLRFTATSNYTAGDTFTVDGIQVTALTPTGEALASGAYIIGSEVLGCLKGTLLTLFISGGTVTTADNALKLGGEEPSYYATASAVGQAQSTATAAGVLANSVQTQLTDLKETLSYSTDEHVVGKWVDGVTDVYEKTVTGFITSYTAYSNFRRFAITLLEGGSTNLVSAEGSFTTNDNSSYTFPTATIEGVGVALSGVAYRLPNGSITLRIDTHSTYNYTSVYVAITVRYTKD